MMSTRLSHLKETKKPPVLKGHSNSCMLCKFYLRVCIKHLVQVTLVYTGFTSLRLDCVSAEWGASRLSSSNKHTNKKLCIYFRNMLCRLKPSLPFEYHNAKAFCHFSAEAQARHSEKTLLQDAYYLPLGFHLGLFFGTPSIPINVNSQIHSSRTLVTLSARESFNLTYSRFTSLMFPGS